MLLENTRLLGFGKLIAGSAAFAIGFWFVLNYAEDVATYRGPVGPAIAAGLPGVFALIGMIELCTGEKIGKIASRWDEMNPWRQRLIGLLVIALAIATTAGIFSSLAVLDLI